MNAMRVTARFLLLLLSLPACHVAAAKSLESEDFRAELSRELYATLDRQQHYFATEAEGRAFELRLMGIARRTRDATSYYRAIAATLASLDEGHTGLVGSAEVPFASTIPPIALLEVEGHPVVAGVAPGIEGGGLRAGDLILEVDDEPAPTVIDRQLRMTAGSTPHGRRARALANLLAGATSVPARVRVRGLDGRVRLGFPLRFLLDDGGENRFRFGFVSSEVISARLSPSAGYLALPDFQAGRADEAEDHLRTLLRLPILVLDLRGNPGGRIEAIQRIAGLFLDRPEILLQIHEEGANEPIEAMLGAFQYKGDLRILVDERTGSAAELLAAGLRDLKRARVYGRPTAGSTRSRRSSLLPGGVTFHYAGTAEFRRRDGSVLEGAGVRPDVYLTRTRESLADGSYGTPKRDPAVRLAVNPN